MSWTKCDCHGRTYTGRASTLYATLAFPDARCSTKTKLCPAGLSDLLGTCERYLTSAAAASASEVDLFAACDWCGEPRGKQGGAAVFLTVYKLGKEREDFAGCVCDEHVVQASQDVFVAM